jgi:hypothetical protein
MRILFKTNLKASLATITDGLGDQVFFGLERHMNYSALGRSKDSEREWNSVLSDMPGSELCHRMQLGFARLTKTVRIDNEPMLAIETPTHYLEEQNLECIQQLAVLGKREVRIIAAQIQQTSFVSPGCVHRQIEAKISHDLG